MQASILTIAGSDSGGGAGIQADIKTATALGVYASSAITALTAQNTQGVFAIHDVPPPFIAEQIRLVLTDIGADAIKTGMLHTPEVIETVASTLEQYAKGIPLIVDPVMYAKGGAPLLKEEAIEALKNQLIKQSYLVTPNIPEAEILSGIAIKNTEDMEAAGKAILDLGTEAVLVKGGHREGKIINDILVCRSATTTFESKRITTQHTHGTGCTLGSAITCLIAKGNTLETAIEDARDYTLNAIKTAPGLGAGHGPLNHAA